MCPRSTDELILCLSMSRNKKTIENVEARIALGHCLGRCRDGSECSSKIHRRGLCTKCYYQFRVVKRGMRPKAAAVFEASCIREGRLLKIQESRVLQCRSVFQQIARKGTA